MKHKMIKKILGGVIKALANTIIDPAVQKVVLEESIITGGCIPSLLLKEKVNDYDIYFTNKNAAFLVADYFLKKLGEDRQEGVDPLTKYPIGSSILVTDDRVKIRVKSAGVISLTSVKNVLDTDPEDQNPFDQQVAANLVEEADSIPGSALEKLKDSRVKKYSPVFISPHAITLSGGVQLVVRFFGPPEEIHRNYDFVHCMGYYVHNGGLSELIIPNKTYESLMSRELMYVGSLYPICSVIRTRKFIARGWTINAGQYLKMAFQISNLDLKDLTVLEDQLTGVDTSFFYAIIREISKTKEERDAEGIEQADWFNSEYVVTLIDRIF